VHLRRESAAREKEMESLKREVADARRDRSKANEEIRSLGVLLQANEKEALEQRARADQAEKELAEARAELQDALDRRDDDVLEQVLGAKAQLMREFKEGRSSTWDPDAEIGKYERWLASFGTPAEPPAEPSADAAAETPPVPKI
jgi:predicted  nucleic acid-binding Zn-ribbon protein